MGDFTVDAPRRTAKQWGGALRPPAPKRKKTGELVIEDAKPADPANTTRAEAVRVVMPALTVPQPPLELDADAIAGEVDDLQSPLEFRRSSAWIVAVVAAVVVATTSLLLWL